MNYEEIQSRMIGGLLGLIVGDALGVPAEFQSRQFLQKSPIIDMVGHGSHNQPAGTWSDDSSMMLCTAEALLNSGYDVDAMMQGFQRWLFHAHMTPHGKIFDVGNATREAIFRYDAGTTASSCGGTDEFSNGNGALMRILPVSLYVSSEPDDIIIKRSFESSALTHGHIRSQLCCAVFSLVVRDLLRLDDLEEALAHAMEIIDPAVPIDERERFSRLSDGSLLTLSATKGRIRSLFSGKTAWVIPDEVRSGGHVIDTLEAAIWCCANADSFDESVLIAVNMGRDTDTTAANTGALAGIMHGRNTIRASWVTSLARKDYVCDLCEQFVRATCKQQRGES